MIKIHTQDLMMKLITTRTILSKRCQSIRVLSSRHVQIKDEKCLNRKYTYSSEKGYLKTQKFFPQENCRLQLRNSTEIEIFQIRLQVISRKL